MTTAQDARLDLLLDAVCAIASVLPPHARREAGASLSSQVHERYLLDEPADTAVAGDLASLLRALDCLPAHGPGNAV